MFLDLLTYNHPLLWMGTGLTLGTLQAILASATANMASRRGLDWQTAFLLSYLPLVPLMWIIYSAKRVRTHEGRFVLRWPSIVGTVLLSAGLLLGLISAVFIEMSLAGPPISALSIEFSSFFIPSAVALILIFLGVSFLLGRLVASWSNTVENRFADDWSYVLSSQKRKTHSNGHVDELTS